MERDATVVRVYPPGYGHTPISADYRPWLRDAEFLAAWRRVRDNTLLDQARLHNLWDLVEQCSRRCTGAVLEVGAWRGGSSALMALRLRAAGDQRRVYVADTFAGVVKAGEQDSYYRGGEHADTSVDRVARFLDDLSLHQCVVLPGMFPDETARDITDSSFALCHIDADVYQSARDVFFWVWPMLQPGGVVVFDDYGFLGCDGVTRLVDELRQRDDLVIAANVNGQALAIKFR